MKKIVVSVLAAVMALGLVACGGSGGGTSGGGAAASTAASSTEAATGGEASANAEVTLGIGWTTASDPNDPYFVTTSTFKEEVEKASGGRIAVELYPSSQLGSEPEMWEGMQIGTCDMALMTNAYVSSFIPANGTLDLPFVFENLDKARSVVDGEYGQKLIQNLNDTSGGVICLTFSEGGFRQLCTRDKGVATPADLNGMKIRCMETTTYLAAYKSLGVNATPMAWGELLTALQQGTVDGCDAPLSVLYTNGFPDICKYIDNVNLFYSPLPICISESVFNSLSAEDQQILRDAATAACKGARASNDEKSKAMEEDLTSQGMTIITEDEVDSAAFQDAVQSAYDELESYVGSEWMSEIKSQVGLQ